MPSIPFVPDTADGGEQAFAAGLLHLSPNATGPQFPEQIFRSAGTGKTPTHGEQNGAGCREELRNGAPVAVIQIRQEGQPDDEPNPEYNARLVVEWTREPGERTGVTVEELGIVEEITAARSDPNQQKWRRTLPAREIEG